MDIQLYKQYLLKILFFLYSIARSLKSITSVCVGLFLYSAFCFIDLFI